MRSKQPRQIFLMGLFERSHMEYVRDRPMDAGGEPSLGEMTSKAIDLLTKNRKGYFLMVEGGRIDHAHHRQRLPRASLTVSLSNRFIGGEILLETLRQYLRYAVRSFSKKPGFTTIVALTLGIGAFRPDSRGITSTWLSIASGPQPTVARAQSAGPRQETASAQRLTYAEKVPCGQLK